MEHRLYGDGIHDDTPAIQERLDSGWCEVVLPVPKKYYLISKPLIVSSHCRLVLPRFARIRLADGADCHMLRSRTKDDCRERLPQDGTAIYRGLFFHVDAYAPEETTENIEICGGIWDFHNAGQRPNPEQTGDFGSFGYTGDCMLFYGVRHLKLSGLTIKDPAHFGVSLDRVSDFTIEDITFDYNQGNPSPINMDGIHCNGNCHRGVIRNLKGACYDDMIALNAHEGSKAPRPERFPFPECKALPLIYLASEIRAGQIKISDLYRREEYLPVETVYIGRNTVIRSLLLDHIVSEDADGGQVKLLYNRGTVQKLEMNHIDERAIICREH